MRHKFVTPGFLRTFGAFLRKHPEAGNKVEAIMDSIVSGEDNRLLMHPLHGPLKGYHSTRISQQYRLIFTLEADAVTFIDIGTHDDVYW